MSIPFTQYLRPTGEPMAVSIARPVPVEVCAQAIIDHGWRFECEELTTGEVSLTVFDPEEEEDVAIEVVRNGPDVPPAVDRLVREALKLLNGGHPAGGETC